MLRISFSNGLFLSTPSARRATPVHAARVAKLFDFYPRPPRGGRRDPWEGQIEDFLFLSTPSARRATYGLDFGWYPDPFLSTPSARRATSGSTAPLSPTTDFYPRPPRGGRRKVHKVDLFQSHFYPRPPRGGRHTIPSAVALQGGISIHALREEGDCVSGDPEFCVLKFLSTPSARRATFSSAASKSRLSRFLSTPSSRRATCPVVSSASAIFFISIHALREEGDADRCRNTYLPGYFYPRPPRGGRPFSRLPRPWF